MKKIVSILGFLLVFPAIAEVMPIYYDAADDVELGYDDAAETSVAPDTTSGAKATSGATASGRVATSRVVSAGARNGNTSTNNNSGTRSGSGRAMASRSGGVSSATAARTVSTRTGNASRTTVARGDSGRGNGNVVRTGVVSRARGVGAVSTTNANGTKAGNATVVRAAQAPNTARVSVLNSSAQPLYNRANINTRMSGIRAASATIASAGKGVSTTSVADTVADLDEKTQLTDYCKAQYTQCMDNFCNVLDDSQGRCSCSANIKKYEKAEAALKSATEQLQDVAKQIYYIGNGMSSEEIASLFTQTEAELALQQKGQDKTQIKNDLDKIKKMITDLRSSSTTSASSSTGLSFDLSGMLDFSFDNSVMDFGSMFGGSSSSSINNQRGEQLHKTAAARCKTAVLNSCTAQGIDASVITNAYDMEIDRQCVAYERSLMDETEQMTNRIFNAKMTLELARLQVATQKNEYETMSECVTHLDECMQDDFVCGSNYDNCLDPTGKFIVNGELVMGGRPGEMVPGSQSWDGTNCTATNNSGCRYAKDGTLYSTWNYGTDGGKSNAWSSSGTLSAYLDDTIKSSSVKKLNSNNMTEFMQYKIGYVDEKNKNSSYGMCMHVLNKCQKYTYENDKFKPDNAVVKEYLARTLVQIKARQDEIVSDFAEGCTTDVVACLTKNGFDPAKENNFNGITGVGSAFRMSYAANRLAVKACLPTIETCMSVQGVISPVTTINAYAEEWICSIGGCNSNSMPNVTYISFVGNDSSHPYTVSKGEYWFNVPDDLANDWFGSHANPTVACAAENDDNCNATVIAQNVTVRCDRINRVCIMTIGNNFPESALVTISFEDGNSEDDQEE